MNDAPDPILEYLYAQKNQLREEFRRTKLKLEDAKAVCNGLSKDLEGTKERLALLDQMVSDRGRDLNGIVGKETPNLPNLGRFANLGAQEAIKLLFESLPKSSLTATEIFDRLKADGFETKSTSPIPTIFMTCQRLCESGFLKRGLARGNRREFSKA